MAAPLKRCSSPDEFGPPAPAQEDLGLTLDDLVVDVAAVNSDVDECTRVLSQLLQTRVLDFQRRLRWARTNMGAEKLELQATVSEQHDELTVLREYQFNQRVAAQPQRFLLHSILLLWSRNRTLRIRRLDAWRRWRALCRDGQGEKRKQRMAVGHFRKRTVRTVFDEWRAWAWHAHHERMKGVLETMCAAAARAEAEKAAARVASLEGELAALRAALQREVTARMALESDARAAFMRSVCALNLEAASLLKAQVPALSR